MIGKAIRQIRESKDLRQKDLADELDTYQAQISRWERGDPPRTRLTEIADALGVTKSHIYQLADDLESVLETGRDRGKAAGGC